MKKVEGFKLRQLGRDYIVTAEGLGHVNFNKMIALNETAAYLWQEIEGKEFTSDDLVKLLLDRYEVTEDVARKDVEALAAKWIEAGIVSE